MTRETIKPDEKLENEIRKFKEDMVKLTDAASKVRVGRMGFDPLLFMLWRKNG